MKKQAIINAYIEEMSCLQGSRLLTQEDAIQALRNALRQPKPEHLWIHKAKDGTVYEIPWKVAKKGGFTTYVERAEEGVGSIDFMEGYLLKRYSEYQVRDEVGRFDRIDEVIEMIGNPEQIKWTTP